MVIIIEIIVLILAIINFIFIHDFAKNNLYSKEDSGLDSVELYYITESFKCSALCVLIFFSIFYLVIELKHHKK